MATFFKNPLKPYKWANAGRGTCIILRGKSMKLLITLFAIAQFSSVNVQAAELVGDLPVGDKVRGETVSVGCKGCHGQDGIAKQPMHPHLAGQSERYLIWQLSAFRSGDRQSHIMNEMAKNLTDQDIADLSAYYTSLSFKCD